MGQAVTMGAIIKCNFGMAPSTLMVTPEKKVVQTTPVANIMDHLPFKNILPFGLCSSLLNPTVATATTAALGVLTPMPCIPVTGSPWVPGSPTIVLGNMPILNNNCKLICSFGGCISILNPGQVKVQLAK